jgi:hypothetical protein
MQLSEGKEGLSRKDGRTAVVMYAEEGCSRPFLHNKLHNNLHNNLHNKLHNNLHNKLHTTARILRKILFRMWLWLSRLGGPANCPKQVPLGGAQPAGPAMRDEPGVGRRLSGPMAQIGRYQTQPS